MPSTIECATQHANMDVTENRNPAARCKSIARKWPLAPACWSCCLQLAAQCRWLEPPCPSRAGSHMPVCCSAMHCFLPAPRQAGARPLVHRCKSRHFLTTTTTTTTTTSNTTNGSSSGCHHVMCVCTLTKERVHRPMGGHFGPTWTNVDQRNVVQGLGWLQVRSQKDALLSYEYNRVLFWPDAAMNPVLGACIGAMTGPRLGRPSPVATEPACQEHS
jgi:hypothetical protein